MGRDHGDAPWVDDELRRWRELLVGVGLSARDDDVIPGAAAAGYYTLEQQHNFIGDVKACGRVAAERDADQGSLTKATPYPLDVATSRCAASPEETSSGPQTRAAHQPP